MFTQRLISSIVLLIILFSIIVVKGVIGLAIFTLAGVFLSVIMVREISDIFCKFSQKKFKYLTEITAVGTFLIVLVGNFYNSDFQWWVIPSVFAILVCWIKTLISFNKPDEFTKVLNFAAVFIFLIIPINFITLIFTVDYGVTNIGIYMLFFLILVTKSGDIGAYIVGTIFSKRKKGNHKIIPILSPKKSWEGTIGGLILSVIIACLLGQYYRINIGISVLLGIVLFIGGFIGDLAESSLKRLTGIKDSGKIIPGIGGSLDLIDSLLINAPVFYLMLNIVGIVW